MPRYLCLLLIFCLWACQSEEKPEQGADSGGAAKQLNLPAKADNRASLPAAPDFRRETPPTPAEIEHADRIIAYSNRLQADLSRGYYSQAESMLANSRSYLADWRQPAKLKSVPKSQLMPEAALFSEREARDMQAGFAGMDKALNALFGHYANLDKYAADANIRDDGKLGRQLASQIRASYANFAASRRSLLAIVQKKAAEAEKILLYEHPLQRQIIVGNQIFAQFSEMAHLLAADTPEPELIAACRQNIETLIAIGAKPPFPAKPGLERLYRAFLKQAGAYCKLVGQNTDFSGQQRRELNKAAQASAEVWNEFVKEANQGGI